MLDPDAIIGGGLSFRQWMREYGVTVRLEEKEKHIAALLTKTEERR